VSSLVRPATPSWALPALAAAGVAGLGLLVFFDLGPALAFNDDWGFAWNARHFGWPPREYPAVSALALVHVAFAWLVTLDHPDQRFLRLSEVPFVLLTMAAGFGIARRLGASRPWAAVAAVAPLAWPVFTADATTFMSDVPYTGLVMGAAWGGTAWLGTGSRGGMAACVVFALLAALERQVGLVIPAAVTAALLLSRPRRRADWIGAGLMWVLAAAAAILPVAAQVAPPTQSNRLAAILDFNPVLPMAALLYLPGMVGLALLPFAIGLWTASSEGSRWRGPLLFGYLLVEGILFLLSGFDVFPGNVFTPRSLNWTNLLGQKPLVFPAWAFLPLEGGAVLTVAALFWRHRLWLPVRGRPVPWLLLLLALFQFLPTLLLAYLTFDRYYLPVVAPLVPLVAAAAGRTTRPGAALGGAVVAVLAGLSFYAVGEQDYQAWQAARDQAARLAYQQASPYEVNAGYEANAVYGEVPYYDRTGRVLSGLAKPGASDFSLDGPKNPKLVLVVAPATDPRPGVTYRSVAPARVVVATPSPTPGR
jgi:hypothetical protein